MDVYIEQCKQARAHDKLYHYTNENGFNAITKFNSLRLSSLELVNDPIENKRINSIWNGKIYVLCFTNRPNDDYFTRLYGAKYRFEISTKLLLSVDEIFSDAKCCHRLEKFKGRSAFEHTAYDSWTDWAVFNASLFDIKYDDNLSVYKLGNYESNAGLIKQVNGIDTDGNLRQWDVENETRLRVAVRPIGFEHVRKSNGFDTPKPPQDKDKKSFLYIKLPEETVVKKL